MVEVTRKEYAGFTVDSVFDCNDVYVRKVTTLVTKLDTQELKLKTEMSIQILRRLKDAVLRSPLVETEVKDLLARERY